jgi:anion-transporting  ArsA/GET3 family ATPase
MAEPPAPEGLRAILDRSRFVVCAGTGGVGKTTVAAAIAVHAARHGRDAVVVTIDPARRLADALGARELGNDPHEIAGVGADGGSLHALMLDTKETFDALVRRYASDAPQAERILSSRFYRNVAGSLAGTGEYMAMEKLHELHDSGRFDLIVVDTPPSQHALAFLDAPRLISRLLSNRLYRVLVRPSRGLARTATSAVHVLVRQLTRVVGADVVDDAIAFFRAFDGMELGFEQRAHEVLGLLRSDDAAFVVVASPRSDTVDAARDFAAQLTADGIEVRAVVANRMTPNFGAEGPGDEGSDDGSDEAAFDAGASPFERNLADLRALARRERRAVATLRAATPGATYVEVPLLPDEVHDLDALAAIADLLTGADAGWGDVRTEG